MLNLYQLEECSICLDVIEKNYRELRCKHKYHKACIEKWLERSTSCPLCMMDIRTNIEQINEDTRNHTFMNKLCAAMCILLIIVIAIVSLHLWNKGF